MGEGGGKVNMKKKRVGDKWEERRRRRDGRGRSRCRRRRTGEGGG